MCRPGMERRRHIAVDRQQGRDMDDLQDDNRLDKLKQALRNIDQPAVPAEPDWQRRFDDSVFEVKSFDALTTYSLSSITASQIQTIDLGNLKNLSSTSVIMGGGGGGGTGGSGSYNYANTAPTFASAAGTWTDTTLRSGKIELTGDHADISINGLSITGVIQEISDKLAILKPDEQMEQDWQELRDLRRQYQEKLEHCRQKSRTWAALKK